MFSILTSFTASDLPLLTDEEKNSASWIYSLLGPYAILSSWGLTRNTN